MKKSIIALMALTAVLALSSCGDTEESSSKSGTVSLVTTTTTTAAETTTTTAASEETPAESDTTTTTEDTTTTTAETTAPPEESTTTTTTTVTTEAPKEDTLADKLSVTYNGATVSVGDKFDDVKGSLGSQAAPMYNVGHCIGEGMDDVYSYNGLTISVFDGKITAFEIMDNLYYGDSAPAAASGLAVGSAEADIKSQLGDPDKEASGQYFYSGDGVYAYIMADSGSVMYIKISDLKESLPEM